MAKKFIRVGFTKASSEKGVFIEGWANKAVVDDVGDMMHFDNVDMKRFEKNPIILFNHNKNLPIGKAVKWKIVPGEGLWVRAKISNSKDPTISCIRDLVDEEILKTFSIGFDPTKEKPNPQGHNDITNWRLNEISIVTLPANIDAEFSLAKELDNVKTLDDARSLVLKFKAMEGTMESKAKPEENPVENFPVVEGKPEDKPEENPEDKKPEEKNAFQECVSAKIPKLIEEGRDQDQAVAVAMSMCREEGKCSIDVMTKEAFEFAKQVAAACGDKKPEDKKPEEKAAPEAVATPVPQPSDDATNYGSPAMDLMKAQLALLGKISEQLGAMSALLAKEESLEENKPVSPEAPPAPNGGESAKELEEVASIKGRIDAIVKSLGV